MVRLALRNIKRNRRRSLLSALAIAVSVLSILTLLSFVDGMQSDMKENLLTYYSGEVRLRHSEYSTYDRFTPLHLSLDQAKILDTLSSMPTLNSLSAQITSPASFIHQGVQYHAQAIGVGELTLHPRLDLSSLLLAGRLPEEGEKGVLLGALLAQNRGITVSDELILIARGADAVVRSKTVPVIGIVHLPVAELNATAIYLPLGDLQGLLAMEGRVQEVLLYGDGQAQPAALAAEVQAHLAKQNIQAESRSFDQISELYGFFVMVRISYFFIALLFFFLGSTVIINTTMMAIYERMSEIGTLKALGMDDTAVRKLFVLEGAILSFFGAAVGLLLGVGVVAILGTVGIDFTDALSGVQMEVSSILYPELRTSSCIFVFLFALVVAIAATYIATRRSERVTIIEALHYR